MDQPFPWLRRELRRSKLQSPASRRRAQKGRRLFRRLRRWIGGLPFAPTVVSYVYRQTPDVLASCPTTEHGWPDTDLATIVVAFRAAYGNHAGARAPHRGPAGDAERPERDPGLVRGGAAPAGQGAFCPRFLLGAGEVAQPTGGQQDVPPLGRTEPEPLALPVTRPSPEDAPVCADCGSIMLRNGTCFKCDNCGSASGCA